MKELEAFLENFSDRIVEKTIERLKEEGLVTKERHEVKYAPPRVAHSITEMARRLDISPWTVKQWMDKGMLEGCYIRQGKTIVFNLDEFERKFSCLTGQELDTELNVR